jgi:hypothetical protein
MNLGSWFRSPQKPPASIPPVSNESADRIDYVDALLAHMLRKSLFSLRIASTEPLPRIGTDTEQAASRANHQAVINRLKVMSRLNPIIYSTPVQGKIEIPLGAHILVYETHFDDKATPPYCLINLRVRRE